MPNDYSNWCPQIFRSIFIDRFNDDKIYVAPCCQAAGKLESVETFDFQTSPYLTELRKQFVNNEKPRACHRCWTAEDLGHKSRRQSAIEFFDIPPSTDVILEGLDHSATWACNLACIMCSPYSSSTWATELGYSKDKLFEIGRQFQKSNNFLDKMDLSNIKIIHFNGGEPMLNNDQAHLLEQLDKQGVLKDTFISYNTNGTVAPTKKIVDLWSRARLVKIFFSIDAVKSAFEYIRWPASWEVTSNNILDMKANLSSNVMFGFNTTVGSYNLLEMPDVVDWFEQNLNNNREGDPSDFCWKVANNFDIKHLPKNIKIYAIDKFASFGRLDGIVSYLKSTLQHLEDTSWQEKLYQLDTRRNSDWKQHLQIGKYY